MKFKSFPSLLFLLSATTSLHAANIVWVSDQVKDNAPTPGFSDQGFIDFLTAAGHTVTRGLAATPDVAALNAADLVILGRSGASGSFDIAAETAVWNTQITTPILATNSYFTRNTRLGWFSNGPVQPDQVLNPLIFNNPLDPVSSYLIGSTAMTGNTTTNSITQAITFPFDGTTDVRGTSLITDTPVVGATIIASTTAGGASAPFIVTWPAGTTLSTNASSTGQVLAGFRMMFLAGNREAGAAPNNALANAGYENLTPEGEAMFRRAVNLSLNEGKVPVPEPGTLSILGLSGAGLLLRRRRADAAHA